MKRKIFTTAALVCCVAVCLAAAIADMTGKWTGSLVAPDGNTYPLNYTFKVDGTTLTGTGSTPEGEVAIANGKVDGDTFSFTIPVNGTDIKNSGKFYAAADSAGLDIDFNGMKFHSTLKRAADK